MNSEKAFVGCLLCYSRQTGEMLAAIDARDLSAEGARVYQAVRELYEQSREIDPVVVIETAGEDLRPYVTEAVLQGEVEHVSAWQEHARIITERAQLQRVQALGLRIAACSGMDDARTALYELQSAAQDRDTRDEWDIGELLRRLVAGMDHKPQVITTGFSALDARLMISPGDFVVVGGRPSSGKTAFTLQMAAHMAKTRSVAYFSLETSPDKLTQRLAANVGGVPLDKLKRKNVENDDDAWRRLADVCAQMRGRQLTVVRAAGYDVARIAAKSQKLGAEVVFVDYLGLVKGSGKDRYEQVTGISVDLHTFAQRTGTVVFALSQLSRAGASGNPELHDLRESGQIEQDADAVLLLDYVGARQDPQTTQHAVSVAKSKEGRVGRLDFRFYGETQRFYSEAER